MGPGTVPPPLVAEEAIPNINGAAVEAVPPVAPENVIDGAPNGREAEDGCSRIEDCDEEPKAPAEPENKPTAKE